MKTGVIGGGLPYVRFGEGERKLVVFPGLADALWDVTHQTWNIASDYRRFAEEYTVYCISRKRGLAKGCTTREMAADYARAFEEEIGPASVMGISLGGYIAQCFAADYPQYVDGLVIACAAHRVSEKGRVIPLRWIELARQQRWREFYGDIVRVATREFQHTFYQFLIPFLRLRPSVTDDFLVSLEACIAHDGDGLLASIQSPALVIGGSEDMFFPASFLRETAERIPQAKLLLIEGDGHGAYETHKDVFVKAVLEFIGSTIKVTNGREPGTSRSESNKWADEETLDYEIEANGN